MALLVLDEFLGHDTVCAGVFPEDRFDFRCVCVYVCVCVCVDVWCVGVWW